MALAEAELREIYGLLKAASEGMLTYYGEEWELDHFDERLVEWRKLKPIVRKVRKLLSQEAVKEVDKRILLRKYGVFGLPVDERIYSELEDAFVNNRRVEIEYFSMSRAEAIKRRVDIYYLSRRYMVAFCHLRGDVRKFRTSRVVSVRVLSERYKVPKDFDKHDYL